MVHRRGVSAGVVGRFDLVNAKRLGPGCATNSSVRDALLHAVLYLGLVEFACCFPGTVGLKAGVAV
jgi:hypothetical protein